MGASEVSRPVLIVDDDLAIRGVLSAILEIEGYPVLLAANGKEALDCLNSGVQPALILLDWMMPVMSGKEFLAISQKDPALAQIPVVIITAFNSIDQNGNPFPLLQKPVDLKTLLETVKNYVRA